MKSTRPGGTIHLALIASIFADALIVEIIQSQLAPFTGFMPGFNALDILRLIFAMTGLVNLTLAFVFLQQPHLARSVGAAFVLAYASIEAIAVYGLVLFLLGGNRFDFYRFAAPALVCQLILWTQADRWDNSDALEQIDSSENGK